VTPMKTAETKNKERKKHAQERREREAAKNPLTPREQRNRVYRRVILYWWFGLGVYIVPRVLLDMDILPSLLISATAFVAALAVFGLPKRE